MLNLDYTKVAFIDFDDTLCIHLNHKRDDVRDWFEAQVMENKFYYLNTDKFAPLPGMRELIYELEQRKIPTFGLTMTDYSTVAPLKLNFVHHYYSKHLQKMICTSTKENKISFIKRYCEMKGIHEWSALLVDNNTDTIHMAMDAGFDIRTPQEISVYYGRH